MGQAKARGSREARIAAAKHRQNNDEPINIPCESCGAKINGFTLVRHTPVGAFWEATCTCGVKTGAIVQPQYCELDRTIASAAQIPEVQQAILTNNVRGLEKSPNTIEMGIIPFTP